MEREAIAVEEADVYLLKWIDDRGRRHPVVKYELTNDRAGEVTLRVEETLPAGITEDDVAFHPKFHADSWSYDDGVATFERELEWGETLVTGFAVRKGTLDDFGVVMVPPVVTALDVPDLGPDPLIAERTEFEELTVDVADVDEPLDSPALAEPIAVIGDDADAADDADEATAGAEEPSEDELIESLIERGSETDDDGESDDDDESGEDGGATVFPAESEPDEAREPPATPEESVTGPSDEQGDSAPPWRDQDDEEGPLDEVGEPIPDDSEPLATDDTPADDDDPNESENDDVPADGEGTDPLTDDVPEDRTEQGPAESEAAPSGDEGDPEFGSPDSTAGSGGSLDPDDSVPTGEEFTTGSLEPTGSTGPPPEDADVVDESSEAATDDVEKAVEAVEQELDLDEEGDGGDDEEFVDDSDGPDARSTDATGDADAAGDADASAEPRPDAADPGTADSAGPGEDDGTEADDTGFVADRSDESPVASGAMQGPEPFSASDDGVVSGPPGAPRSGQSSSTDRDVAGDDAGATAVDDAAERRDEPTEEPQDGAVETTVETDTDTTERTDAEDGVDEAERTDAEDGVDEKASERSAEATDSEPETGTPPVAEVATTVPVADDYTVGDLVDAAAYTELRAEGVDPRVVVDGIRDVLYDLAADRNYDLSGASDVLQFRQETIGTRTGSAEGQVTAVGPWRRLASDSVEYTRRRSGLAATLLLVGFAALVAGGLLRSGLGVAPDVAATLSIRRATVTTEFAIGSFALGAVLGIGGLLAYLRPASHTSERAYYYREIQQILLAGPVSEREVETDVGTLTDLYGDLRVHLGTDVQVVVREDGTESVRSPSDLTEEERGDLAVSHDGFVTATCDRVEDLVVQRRRRSDVLE